MQYCVDRYLIRLQLIVILLPFIIISCSEESNFGAQEPVLQEIPNSLKALDFPTADGTLWQYVSSNGDYRYKAKVSGTRNVSGSTVRIMEIDANKPVDYIGSAYGFPIRRSFFVKSYDAYVEHGFELWIQMMNDTYFQRSIPSRTIWSFPIYNGKEWVVSRSYTSPQITFTRKVTSDNQTLTTPLGTFNNAFCIEEYLSTSERTDQLMISKYWVAKGYGVIKYEYLDAQSLQQATYLLERFER